MSKSLHQAIHTYRREEPQPDRYPVARQHRNQDILAQVMLDAHTKHAHAVADHYHTTQTH